MRADWWNDDTGPYVDPRHDVPDHACTFGQLWRLYSGDRAAAAYLWEISPAHVELRCALNDSLKITRTFMGSDAPTRAYAEAYEIRKRLEAFGWGATVGSSMV